MSSESAGLLTRALDRLRGRPIVRNLSAFRPALEAIGALAPALESASDGQIRERALRVRGAVRDGADPGRVVAEGFALAREASRRTLGMRPFDVQVLAGLVLHEGNLVEMATGEGKTLAAVAPAWLRALEGRGAHVLTFNDYLARRDAAWMRPVYELLGVSVGAIQEGMAPAERRRAYRADVTYATAKEAGFDYLRGFLVRDPGELVLRPFHYAIVDEADSILIDEARVPLVIAGDVGRKAGRGQRLAALAAGMERGLHFETDEHARNVILTDRGYELLERSLGCGSLMEPGNLDLLIEINCALHARVLLRRDVDYIVRDGRVELVDEFTGRVVDDRQLPDGLQAAVEAKEGLTAGAVGAVLGSVTLQHFLDHYPRLAGMTATASSAAEELREFYGMKTVVIPSNRPSVRVDHPDVVFTHREAKHGALVREIARVHGTRRPVLVGTASVEESEELALALRDAGVDCRVLNARRDEAEARIVAEAGAPGAVTISTNMAGRGTDIRLGGRDERDRAEVVALGGLYVIGTNRHESRRIDSQLRGRAGRQGDPGSTRFFISLEDPVIARFGVGRLIGDERRPEPADEPLDHPFVRREVLRAQRIAEGENLEIRRTLTFYSSMLEKQRTQIHDRRQAILTGDDGLLEQAAPERYAALARELGRPALETAEREIALAHIDRTWREHLAHAADLREGIHLMRLARLDPLAEFQKGIIDAWSERFRRLDEDIIRTFEEVEIGPDGVALETAGLQAPSSTWTYLVNDNPFEDQLFTRVGGTAMGIGLALNVHLLLAWWIYRRFFMKRRRPRS